MVTQLYPVLSAVACCYIVMDGVEERTYFCLFTDKYVKYILWKYFKGSVYAHRADSKR